MSSSDPASGGGVMFRRLDDSSILKISRILAPYWVRGNRQMMLVLYLSGWWAKAKIHPVSTAEVVSAIALEKNDEELEQELSAVYYSYKKLYGGNLPELAELDEYVERLKRKGVVKRNVSRGEDIKPVEATGIQEILESIADEEHALEVIRQLTEIVGYASPYRDSITVITRYKPLIGYTNNVRKLMIYQVEIKDGRVVVPRKLVWDGAITSLTVYENPLGGVTRYEITWETKVGINGIDSLRLGPATFKDIYNRLRSEGFLLTSGFGRSALASIVHELIRYGKAEIISEPEQPASTPPRRSR